MNTYRVNRMCAHTHKKRSIIEKCDFQSHVIFTTKIAFFSPRDRIGDVNMINTLKTNEDEKLVFKVFIILRYFYFIWRWPCRGRIFICSRWEFSKVKCLLLGAFEFLKHQPSFFSSPPPMIPIGYYKGKLKKTS